MPGGSLLSRAVPKLSTAGISLASCPRQSMQGQEWRKEVQCYLLFRGKNLASLWPGISVSMTYRAPQEADPLRGGAGQCSRSQGGDQTLTAARRAVARPSYSQPSPRQMILWAGM